MSDINPNVQDEWHGYVDEPDKAEALDNDDAGGTSPQSLSLPDEAPRVEIISAVAYAISQAIEAERKRIATVNQYEYNSKNVLFATYSVPAQPIQICREKSHRGDTVITSFAEGDVYIGLHVGIIVGGTDTVRIGPGASRTIKTRQALWAIAAAASTIDVQEEYD